jgi:hypothetical protein
MKQSPPKITEVPTIETSLYNAKPLAVALATLSRAEIESMLANIISLETHIAKLDIAGHEDEMMHLVTEGLHRLTYFLDAVRQHKDETDDGAQNGISIPT